MGDPHLSDAESSVARSGVFLTHAGKPMHTSFHVVRGGGERAERAPSCRRSADPPPGPAPALSPGST